MTKPAKPESRDYDLKRSVKYHIRREAKEFMGDSILMRGWRVFNYCVQCTGYISFAILAKPVIKPILDQGVSMSLAAKAATHRATLEAAVIGGETMAYIGERVPLPKGFPAPRGIPFDPLPVMLSSTTFSGFTHHGPFTQSISQGETGPAAFESFKFEAVGRIEVGPRPTRVTATAEGRLA